MKSPKTTREKITKVVIQELLVESYLNWHKKNVPNKIFTIEALIGLEPGITYEHVYQVVTRLVEQKLLHQSLWALPPPEKAYLIYKFLPFTKNQQKLLTKNRNKFTKTIP